MKNTDLWKKTGIGCCAAILLSAGTVASSAPKAEHIATMYFSPDAAEVWWEPNRKSKYGFIKVSISGPDDWGSDSEMFPYGEEPFFNQLIDGQYTYELYKAPPGTAMSRGKGPRAGSGPADSNGRTEQDRAARAPGQENAQRGFIQSGSFSIENGDLVDPSIPEG